MAFPADYRVRRYYDRKLKELLAKNTLPTGARIKIGDKVHRLIEDSGPKTPAATRFQFSEPGVHDPASFTAAYIVYRKDDARLWGIGNRNGLIDEAGTPEELASLRFSAEELGDITKISPPFEPNSSKKAGSGRRFKETNTGELPLATAKKGRTVATPAAPATAPTAKPTPAPKAAPVVAKKSTRATAAGVIPPAPKAPVEKAPKSRKPAAAAPAAASTGTGPTLYDTLSNLSDKQKAQAFGKMMEEFAVYSEATNAAMLRGEDITTFQVFVVNNMGSCRPRLENGRVILDGYRNEVAGVIFMVDGKEHMLDFRKFLPDAKGKGATS